MPSRFIFRSRKTAVGAIAALALAVLYLLFGAPGYAGGNRAVVDFNYAQSASPDLVYLADELGYFRNTHARPHYVTPVSATQIVPLVSTGDLDFGTRMMPLVISALAAGADIKVIAQDGQASRDQPHMSYFVERGSNIRSPKDFEGKTVALGDDGSCAELVTRLYLRRHGVDPDKVNWVTIADDQSVAAVARRNVDVAITHPPYSNAAASDSRVRLLWTDWDLDRGRGSTGAYIVNGAFLRSHPLAVSDFVGAIAKAGLWAAAHPEQAQRWAAERLGVDIETVELDAYSPTLAVEDAPIQYYIDALEQEGRIPPGKIRVSDVYTNAYNPLLQNSAANASAANLDTAHHG